MDMQRLPDGRFKVGAATFDRAEDAFAYAEQRNQPPPMAQKTSGGGGAIKWIVGLLGGGFILVMIIGTVAGNSPEGRAKAEQRDAIKFCWSEQARKSFAPDTQRFVAGACETLERQFRDRFGYAP